MPRKQFHFPVVLFIAEITAIIIGWLTAFTSVVAANGLGQDPATADALCQSLKLHTSACREFSTLDTIGDLLLAFGIIALIITAIVTAVRHRKASR